jgi:hypothetical protein
MIWVILGDIFKQTLAGSFEFCHLILAIWSSQTWCLGWGVCAVSLPQSAEGYFRFMLPWDTSLFSFLAFCSLALLLVSLEGCVQRLTLILLCSVPGAGRAEPWMVRFFTSSAFLSLWESWCSASQLCSLQILLKDDPLRSSLKLNQTWRGLVLWKCFSSYNASFVDWLQPSCLWLLSIQSQACSWLGAASHWDGWSAFPVLVFRDLGIVQGPFLFLVIESKDCCRKAMLSPSAYWSLFFLSVSVLKLGQSQHLLKFA